MDKEVSGLKFGEAFELLRSTNSKYLVCDVFDKPLKIVNGLTNGLGKIYRKGSDGYPERVSF